MVGDRTRRSSSASSSTWASSNESSGETWAVRPSNIMNFLRRKVTVVRDTPITSNYTSVPTIKTPVYDLNRAHLPDELTTLQPVQSSLSSRTSSPVLAAEPLSFQWIRGDLIGKGSFGRVYWALNVTTGDVIAVKQVEVDPHPSRRERESIEALKFESYTLRDLDHPNIVQFLGFEESPERLSIFMEYVAGGTIGSCLKAHGKFHDEVTKSFTRQVLEGLEYLHSRKVIHRDIKADNILVEKSGICKISDFGISKHTESEDRAYTEMKGTIWWISPESLTPKQSGGYTSKIDIWSMGCVVLEMWSGRRPWFEDKEIFSVMLKLADKKSPPIPPDIHLDDKAMDFRNKCFTSIPEDRPSATQLRSHPYLVMSPGWKFDPAYIEGPSNNRETGSETVRTIRRTKSHSTMATKTIRRIGSTKNLPPVPTLPPLPSNLPPIPPSISPPIPRELPKAHSDNRSFTPPSATPSDSPGPPIVYITPLSSPARSNPQLVPDDNTSSPSTSSSSRWSARPRRSFHVVNPDPDPEDEFSPSPSFIYSPPPLPDFSDRLASRLSVRRAPSTPVMRTQAPPSSSRFKHASSAIVNPPVFHSDSDEDANTSLSMREEPPRIPKNKRESAWARPFIEDVYKDLGHFFPDHDIDRPIVIEATTAPSSFAQDKRSSGLRAKKSIRMVAEEHSRATQRKSKRATKLWNSHLEELGSTRS